MPERRHDDRRDRTEPQPHQDGRRHNHRHTEAANPLQKRGKGPADDEGLHASIWRQSWQRRRQRADPASFIDDSVQKVGGPDDQKYIDGQEEGLGLSDGEDFHTGAVAGPCDDGRRQPSRRPGACRRPAESQDQNNEEDDRESGEEPGNEHASTARRNGCGLRHRLDCAAAGRAILACGLAPMRSAIWSPVELRRARTAVPGTAGRLPDGRPA
jgi:hypothetical protein